MFNFFCTQQKRNGSSALKKKRVSKHETKQEDSSSSEEDETSSSSSTSTESTRKSAKPKHSSKKMLTNNPFINFLAHLWIRHCDWPAEKITAESAKSWSGENKVNVCKGRKIKNEISKLKQRHLQAKTSLDFLQSGKLINSRSNNTPQNENKVKRIQFKRRGKL